MELLPEFACTIQRGDHFRSFDIKKSYRHMILAPTMRYWFLLRYAEWHLQWADLSFVWGRPPLLFTKLMAIPVRVLQTFGYRTSAYLNDVVVFPSPYGAVAYTESCQTTRVSIKKLLGEWGAVRNLIEGTGPRNRLSIIYAF